MLSLEITQCLSILNAQSPINSLDWPVLGIFLVGFCGLLHCWSWDDDLVLSYFRWNGVCKWFLILLCSFCLTNRQIFAQFWSLEFGNAFPGCSSPSFHDSYNVCYVDRWRAALYLHGFGFWGNHSQRQFEMVVPISCKHCLYQHILHRPYHWRESCAPTKVPWCCWNEENQSVCYQWSSHVFSLDGIWSIHSYSNIPFSFHKCLLSSVLDLIKTYVVICRLPEYCCLYTCFTMSTYTITRYTATLQLSYLHCWE